MGRINVLEDDVINKIAAGEVVERPASVLKELVENAIDAGATAIDVQLEQGGIKSIAVTDNGYGMDSEDAELAMKRHATSKIQRADDLFSLHSMGFRGEALASISAVSRFSLATREREAEAGVKISLQDGAELLKWAWQGPSGTTISVDELFYNIPARAKFLKSAATEYSHCLEIMQAFCLCHPQVAFTVKHNGKDQLRVPRVSVSGEGRFGDGALRARAEVILGKEVSSQLRYIQGEGRYGRIEGLISPPGFEKVNSRGMFAFVNGRLVKDKVVRYGLLRGYHSHILKGRFPIAILHLTMDPALVDCNVHPAKTEVRFQYADEVQSLIAIAVRDCLRHGGWAEPAVPLASPPPVPVISNEVRQGAWQGHSQGGRPYVDSEVTTSRREFTGATRPAIPFSTYAPPTELTDKAGIENLLRSTPASSYSEQQAAPFKTSTIDWASLQYVGSFAKCYLMFESTDQLLVVDQHAFHERIIFERLERDKTLLTQSQRLLVPESLELEPAQVARLKETATELSARGFTFDVEGDTTIAVTAVPTLLAGKDLAHTFRALSSYDSTSEEFGDTNAELARLVLATIACHSAVRAGEDLTLQELQQLLKEAQDVDFYLNCPHGRRVFKWWAKRDVMGWFDR